MPFQIKFYCDCVIDNTILFHKHLLNTEEKSSSENKEEDENALIMRSLLYSLLALYIFKKLTHLCMLFLAFHLYLDYLLILDQKNQYIVNSFIYTQY